MPSIHPFWIPGRCQACVGKGCSHLPRQASCGAWAALHRWWLHALLWWSRRGSEVHRDSKTWLWTCALYIEMRIHVLTEGSLMFCDFEGIRFMFCDSTCSGSDETICFWKPFICLWKLSSICLWKIRSSFQKLRGHSQHEQTWCILFTDNPKVSKTSVWASTIFIISEVLVLEGFISWRVLLPSTNFNKGSQGWSLLMPLTSTTIKAKRGSFSFIVGPMDSSSHRTGR